MEYKKYLQQIGSRLKRQRMALGYTQKELADIIAKNNPSTNESAELSDKQISRFECGENSTRIDKLVELTIALGKTPDFFLLGIDRSDKSTDKTIEQICEYLKLCSEDDISNVLSIVKVLSEKRNKK